ncbi:LOW QUALITY PROTEIN: BTB/POZ domain-containing protein 1 [Procambarus clarkii]|uniref:LOW QUALITY PROTEIN: BTB/POZ domain-containing protein 1 n=1 Tax=Procambarus clarkii TaxID=6728 RepID=UPI001E678451|nr:BTB/POZ domain-containing protein 1-like [Procambarus clarkii]
MAWSGNTTPSNGAFSRLRNMHDPDMSSSEECLVYTPGGSSGSKGDNFIPSSSSSSPGLPSNHQANIAHSGAASLSSGNSIDCSTTAPPPSPASPTLHTNHVGTSAGVGVLRRSSVLSSPVPARSAIPPHLPPVIPPSSVPHPSTLPVGLVPAGPPSTPPSAAAAPSPPPPPPPPPPPLVSAPPLSQVSVITSSSPQLASIVATSTTTTVSSPTRVSNVPSSTPSGNNSSSISIVSTTTTTTSTSTNTSAVTTSNGGPMYNWQATMTTVKERFAFLFNNEILSDVHFLVGKGDSRQRIPAHKFVLAVGSAVFDAMFNGQLSTRQEEIELPDVEPQAFLALLRFLYSDEVQIGPETVMTVLYTAKKYAVPALEQACVDFLKRNLSSDNAFMLLTQARLFDEPQLAALCLETIDKNTADSLAAEGFTDIDSNTLCLVLERDTLRIREAKLFEATVRWSEAECERDGLSVTSTNQRTVLGRALSLVRFPLMTVEEFAQGPAQSGILTDREVVQLFLHFTVNPKPPVNFLDVPRCCMTGKEQTVCRFQQIESRWGYSGTSDRIRFIVDRRIFVVGFGMYGSIHGPSEYEVTIQIIHTATGKVCASNDTSFTSDGTVNTFRVMFKEPVEVLPNTNYTAYATLKGPDSHYGTKGVRKVAVECPSGDRATFQFTYAAGNNNGTSVEDGQIPEIIFYT